MYSTTYTAHHQHIGRAPVKSVVIQSPQIKPSIKRFLWIALAVNTALVGVIYAALFMFPQEKYSVTNLAAHEISVGPATERFIKEMKTSTIKPIPAAIVTRAPLTVEGRAISLGGDNIQVFEYDNAKTAREEAGLMVKEYEPSMKESILPEKYVHIYAKDNLLIFYMGSNESIIKLITQNSYQSMEGVSLYSYDEVSAVSKNGSYYK